MLNGHTPFSICTRIARRHGAVSTATPGRQAGAVLGAFYSFFNVAAIDIIHTGFFGKVRRFAGNIGDTAVDNNGSIQDERDGAFCLFVFMSAGD